MAGELQADVTTGQTVYFLVRSATGTIWNGSSLEAYATANLATYAVTGTEQGTGSGLYVGNMPAAAAGVYNIVAKVRAGASPAESDVTVGVGEIEWDGSAVAGLGVSEAEPTGVPAASASLITKIGYLYMALRNAVTVTDSKKTFFDDSGNAEWEKDLSDNGTTYTETEGNSI